MTIPAPAAIISFAALAAVLFTALWMGIPRWRRYRATRRRERREARWEHARLSLRHKRAWRAIKRGNRDVAERSQKITAVMEDGRNRR